ncbi:hypothetical protein [Nevskia sp.]|nr:hypothetical protein [Nevskia sp.]
MVSTTLFSSRNAKAALALQAATGCPRGTCYAGAELQRPEVMTMSLH